MNATPDHGSADAQSPNELSPDALVVQQIRQGDEDAWQRLIDRYERRLLAYVRHRIADQAAAQDIVQDAFVGFLVSLPNYDGGRPLESYLFSICAYKLTDHLRRQGRRPALQLLGRSSSAGPVDLPGSQRVASSIARSGERKRLEAMAVQEAIAEQIQRWKSGDNWIKLQAIELSFVLGWGNKRIAETLDVSEQQVANYKSDFLIRLKAMVKRADLDTAVFPELFDEDDE
ncbi:ECF RNA polymerase sigma-E factor [Stieleria bergensis]|uniref:ECF RNA polymerase sigma-E factor n=1 Tax=Stieleria bergensis TaxID=2528025 RepID=A0A517SST8_9BACT|nr:ECF RNA polymerase sigma-E factor [Planctomycetes bacterium SV_7m_r]